MPNLPVGNVDYPDVRGMAQADAEAALTNVFLTFVYGTASYSATVASGDILTQSPDPTTNATVDPSTTTVTLTVSLGVDPAFEGLPPAPQVANLQSPKCAILINPTTGLAYKSGFADASSILPMPNFNSPLSAVLVDTTGTPYAAH
jgi:hypothetical protein